MDATPGRVWQSFQSVGNSNGGSVRHTCEQTTAKLCVATARPPSMGNRCTHHELVGDVRVPVSTIRAASPSAPKDCDDPGQVPSGGAELAGAPVVSIASDTTNRCATSPAITPGPSNTAQGTDMPPKPVSPKSTRLAAIVQLTIAAGFPVHVAEKIAATVRPSTAQVYESKWARWITWCRQREVNPWSPTAVILSEFLTELFNSGLSVSAIRGYRSTLNSVFRASGHEDLTQNPYIVSLLRAFSIERPVSRKLFPQWDLALVLRSLLAHPYEPLGEADLSFVTKKTAFLLALASGARRSELSALSFDPAHLQFAPGYTSVRLLPQADFRPKTQPSHTPLKPIDIPALQHVTGPEEERLLCPVRALKYYIDRTRPAHIRQGRSKLFIPFQIRAQVKEVKPAMLSRWISGVIFQAYRSEPSSHDTDNARFTAHEVRAVAASYAYYSHVPLEEVLQAASWQHATTFTSHYLRDLSTQSNGIFTLGPFVAAQHVINPGP